MFEFCCPLCQSNDIVVDRQITQICLVGIDPETGLTVIGSPISTEEVHEVFRFYLCRSCDYMNIDKTMFVKKVA